MISKKMLKGRENLLKALKATIPQKLHFTLINDLFPRIKYLVKSLLIFFTGMQTASKSLMETLSEIYENEWPGHDLLYVQVNKKVRY